MHTQASSLRSNAPGGPLSFVDVRTDDAQAQARCLGDLDQSYQQLSPGHFSGSLLGVRRDEVAVFREELNQSVFQTGATAAGHITLAVACELSAPAYWNGRHLGTNDVVAFTPGREFELRTPTRAVCVGLSFPAERLSVLGLECPAEDWSLALSRLDCWSGGGELKAKLLRLLINSSSGDPADDDRGDPASVCAWAIDHIGRILEAQQRETGLRPGNYPRLARRARQWMLERIGEAFSVSDLCAALGCSRRALQYAFESVYGTNPVAYLRALRLGRVRQALQSATADTTVQDVAAAFGFSHLPRFSQEYARMFGERPSQSLAHGRRLSS